MSARRKFPDELRQRAVKLVRRRGRRARHEPQGGLPGQWASSWVSTWNPARLGDRAEIDDGDKLESPPRRRRGIAISELDAFLGRAAHLATRDGEIRRPHRHAPSFAWRP
jgi:transposase-like protein